MNRKIFRLTFDSVMIALCFILSAFLTIRAGNLRFSLGSLPVVVTALLFGPLDALIVALGGEFFNQLLSYGITPTTPLWLVPTAFRAIIAGFGAKYCEKHGFFMERMPLVYFPTLICAALATTAANTLAIWLDSIIYGYYSPAYVFGDLLVRIGVAVVTAVAVAAVSIPVVMAGRRALGEKLPTVENK